MSITLDVYPSEDIYPSLREVVGLTTKKLNGFLKDYEINFEADIKVTRVSKKDNTQTKVDLDDEAKWDNEHEYLWFTVSSFVGGIDVYFWKLEDDELADDIEVVDSKVGAEWYVNKVEGRREFVQKCFRHRRQWHVKKWANQSAPLTYIMFGFIASSFAELTNGIIDSCDGGGEYQIFPATAEEFDSVFCRPEKAISENLREDPKIFAKSLQNGLDTYHESSKRNERI